MSERCLCFSGAISKSDVDDGSSHESIRHGDHRWMGRILANFSLLMDMEGLLPVSHHSDFLFFFACCKELFLDGYVTWNDTCNDDVSNSSFSRPFSSDLRASRFSFSSTALPILLHFSPSVPWILPLIRDNLCLFHLSPNMCKFVHLKVRRVNHGFAFFSSKRNVTKPDCWQMRYCCCRRASVS